MVLREEVRGRLRVVLEKVAHEFRAIDGCSESTSRAKVRKRSGVGARHEVGEAASSGLGENHAARLKCWK